MECPFINDGDARCEQVLRIDCLEHVMGICGGDFERCPIYQELRERERERNRTELRVRRCA